MMPFLMAFVSLDYENRYDAIFSSSRVPLVFFVFHTNVSVCLGP